MLTARAAVLFATALWAVIAAAVAASAAGLPFVTRNGSTILELGKPFRFSSFNIPNLHYLEDRGSPRTFPTAQEQQDALRSIAQIGGRVTRMYVLSVATTSDTGSYVHIAAGSNGNPPKNAAPLGWVPIPQVNSSSVQLYANEELFVALDHAFANCWRPWHRWEWWGGITQFAQLYGGSMDDFFKKQEIIDGFLSVVRYVLNRKNTVNGLLYKEDGTCFAWETGNELFTSSNGPVPASWTTTVAKYIKSIDSNHLVLDGQYGLHGWDSASIASPYIDIFSNHYYADDYAKSASTDTAFFGARNKAFIIGEFGLASFDKLNSLVSTFDTLVNATGLLIWSLRYHARDGGFYTHSEGSPYSSYHWPGFAASSDGLFPADELKVVAMMHQSALKYTPQTKYLTEPPFPVPVLFNLTKSGSNLQLRWMGSSGAANYTVERSNSSAAGPWTVVSSAALDSKTYGSTLFQDAIPSAAKALWYRVSGVNQYGTSGPSNVISIAL
ncbi:glycoside hydrolase superfamily [Zopfochytrium polystomum]|nr:glycoside hydrolase superfamily [Zopfochytrium polystomum]